MHHFMTEKQLYEIEERCKSLQKLMMMDVEALIKEVREYRICFGTTDDGKGMKRNKSSSERSNTEGSKVIFGLRSELPPMLDARDIQKVLNIGRRKTYELLNDPPFRVKRVGNSDRGMIRVPRDEFLNWLEGK